MKAAYKKYSLNFKQPGGTSRGVLHTKETYFLMLSQNENSGVGECGLFKGLSADDRTDYEKKLQWLCDSIKLETDFLLNELSEFPSIQFGLEQALLSLKSKDKFILFPSIFTEGKDAIPINGLIWMGTADFMKQQIKEKLASGFTTLKLKIGAIDFEAEIEILKSIRKEFTSKEIEIRVDANGAFTPKNALEKLKRLSDYNLHSIEQPIKVGQWQEMALFCEKTPLPIALDEELIGVFKKEDKQKLMETICPQYIILKPSLIGGIHGSNQWVEIANQNNVLWWITSALESNIGLNAIAQFTYSLKATMPQGLGTGGLFTNNFDSPLVIKNGELYYNPKLKWQFGF